ncbi:MAG: hypothetical protein BWY87_00808 [Deltaproteobacteria bacterium ADurb.Bin510]|nr:MAG: hypothetical protein BWY87_00808 [Deltaproteobacteria bacterium ADurb.Bin510]
MVIQPASNLTSLNQTASPTSGGGRSPAAPTSAIEDSYYDKKDLNKDGYVSYLEELLYALEHPSENVSSQSYNTKGELNKASGTRLIDTFI